jgi:hypothetical protein
MYFEDIKNIDDEFDLILDKESIYTLEWNDVIETYSTISKKLKKNGIFISFFYNKEHPDIKYLSETIDGNTYYNPTSKAFGNSKRVSLFDENSLNEVCNKSNLEIIQLYNHKILPLIGNDNSDNGISEYIIVLNSTL